MNTSSVILARETTTTPFGVPGRNVATKVLISIPVNNNRGRTTRKQQQRLKAARREAVAVAADDDDDEEVLVKSSDSKSFRLILMRHSEAAEEDEENKKYRRDIDRPLTERGIMYAKKLSENLKTICGDEWMPTRIVCSSARRTRETLMAMDLVPTMSIFNDKVSSSSNNNNNTVVYLGSIYHYAGMDGVFGSHVKQLIIGESETFEGGQTDEVVLIVGHNRGLEEAVREFTGETNVEMNVASLACLRKRKEAKTRETWEQALEEKDDPNDPKKSSLWTFEHLLDPNGQCLDCGWGDVPRG